MKKSPDFYCSEGIVNRHSMTHREYRWRKENDPGFNALKKKLVQVATHRLCAELKEQKDPEEVSALIREEDRLRLEIQKYESANPIPTGIFE